MLCIRNFKTFANVIGNNVNIRGSGIVEDAVIRALKVWGNGGHFVTDDGSFHPPVALDMMQFGQMCIAVDTISECIHEEIEWEVRTGRDVIGAKGPKFKLTDLEDVRPEAETQEALDAQAAKMIEEENREWREDVLANRPKKEDAEGRSITEIAGRAAVNEAKGLRRELYDAHCENTRLESVNDNLQEQIVTRAQELRDVVAEAEAEGDDEDLVAIILYTRSYNSIRKEADVLLETHHFGFAPRENAMLVLAYWAGILDGAKVKGFTAEFAPEGASVNLVTWLNSKTIPATHSYQLLLEPAPTYISGCDTTDMFQILDELNDEFQVTTMPDSGTLDRSLGGASS